MVDPKEHHIQFEAKKLSMIHTKRDGHVLRLAINPHDSPEDLFRDEVDQRYLVVLVKLASETDEIVPINQEGNKAIGLFMELARNADFQHWLYVRSAIQEMTEDAAAEALKEMIGIASRTELKLSQDKRNRLFAIRDEWRYHIRPR